MGDFRVFRKVLIIHLSWPWSALNTNIIKSGIFITKVDKASKENKYNHSVHFHNFCCLRTCWSTMKVPWIYQKSPIIGLYFSTSSTLSNDPIWDWGETGGAIVSTLLSIDRRLGEVNELVIKSTLCCFNELLIHSHLIWMEVFLLNSLTSELITFQWINCVTSAIDTFTRRAKERIPLQRHFKIRLSTIPTLSDCFARVFYNWACPVRSALHWRLNSTI